ncbi:phosphoinositide phosphatase SAC8 isoform X1 [Arachis stenosperma]|uniref:phosphoinositide phosphatase SAC8 isoform X1 n=1 Tax=Arachis stenosperma TaxID=217475 RepID=UPI0025AB7DC3|nr:phosphoinositide phosphatase SAC8 isoform X1 [Arachis stenosperma]
MDIEPSLVGSAERFKLDHELELHEFEDKFVIKSLQSPNQGFWISRRDGNINFLDDEICSGSPSRTSTIYGVVGTIRLVVGTYVVVITSCKEVGSFLGYPVYRVMSMRVLACNDALKFSTGQEKKDEAYFMTLLNIVESTPGLYYSYETDITLNLQRRNKLVEGWMSKPLWKQADPRYIWNRHLSEELIECKLDRFIVPIIQGSFQVAELKLKDSHAMVTLVSRRCNRRLGTRMWRRGANLEGDAANFIETEQLLETEGFRSSFLQVRGSIPLLWEQIVDLSYKPHLSVIKHEQTPLVVERHFSDLSQRYGEIIAIDLTEKHGEEGQLSAAYAAEMKNVPNVRYVPFDFHGHCKDSNFDNLEILYDQISEDAEKQRYFLIDREGNVLEEQKGVIRSNCVDSLDRTNVTQCYLAQKALNLQLQRIGVLSPSECISMFDEEYGKYRALWAEQGDEISLEYTGTHALKGDIVRYGKQTIFGMIKDGMSALSRYYLNNFHDGIRQDALDLISGHYTVNRNSLSPIGQNGFDPFSPLQHNLNAVSGNTLCLTSTNTSIEYDTFLPVTSALIIGGLTATTLTVQQVGRNVHQYVSTAICAGITAGVMAILKANGRQFCSRPRLCGLL